MKMKKLVSLLSAMTMMLSSTIAFASNTGTERGGINNEIIIRSELASPVVLADKVTPNYLKVSLKGFPLQAKERPQLNLVLVVDRSSSMSGDRIEKARKAAIMAVEILDPKDTLSIVAYDSGVEVIIPAGELKDKQAIIKKINQQLTPRGMTALFAGLSKGIDEVTKNLDPNKVNRIVLLSDGQANVGPTSVKELSELTKLAAEKGVAVSTFGIGNDYNEDLMVAIANYSDGNHAYVKNIADLEGILNKEFKDSMSVVAQNFEITIELAKGAKPIRLLGRDGEIKDNKITVNMNQVYANQEKYVLLELEPMNGKLDEEKVLANVNVSYTNAVTQKAERSKTPIMISYTNDSEQVTKNVKDDVIVETMVQKAAIVQEEAAEYLEKGDVHKARAAYSGLNADWGSFSMGRQNNPFADATNDSKVKEMQVEFESMEEELKKDNVDKKVIRKDIKAKNIRIQKQL